MVTIRYSRIKVISMDISFGCRRGKGRRILRSNKVGLYFKKKNTSLLFYMHKKCFA